jgi:hypothetical protein
MQFHRKRFFTSAFFAVVLSFPITGFIYGYNACKDCGNSILGRFFIGFVEAFLTTITLGNPVDNEGGSVATNLRWYVLFVFILLTLLFYFRFLNRRK